MLSDISRHTITSTEWKNTSDLLLNSRVKKRIPVLSLEMNTKCSGMFHICIHTYIQREKGREGEGEFSSCLVWQCVLNKRLESLEPSTNVLIEDLPLHERRQFNVCAFYPVYFSDWLSDINMKEFDCTSWGLLSIILTALLGTGATHALFNYLAPSISQYFLFRTCILYLKMVAEAAIHFASI